MVKFTEKKLDITADDKIFTPRGVGALNIGVIQCLSELVANSLDWKRFSSREIQNIERDLKEGEKNLSEFNQLYKTLLEAEPVDTVITIKYNKNSIEIWDNAIGMSLDELEIGLKLRAASDKKREPLRSRKGMFGMGLKVGILGMGWKFIIRTRSYVKKKECGIEIDTKDIEKGKLQLRSVIGREYDEYDKSGPLSDIESGTYIRIEKLHKRKHKPEIWRQELGRNFSPEIEYEGVKIIVIDNNLDENIELEPCKPEIINIIPETKIHLDHLNLEVVPDHEDNNEPIKIRGWLALRQKMASGSGRWGLHTFRKGQLVEAFHNEGPRTNGLLPYNPHPNYARLHGEVHLDMCEPNFTKLGWNTELQSWNAVSVALRDVLEKVMKAAKEFRVKLGGGAKARNLIQKAQAQAQESIAKIAESKNGDDTDEKPLEDSLSHIAIGDDRYLKISISTQSLPNNGKFWDFSFRPESDEIAVMINMESILWQWAQERSGAENLAALIVNWAIVDSLYFCLIDEIGIEPTRAIHLRDEWHMKLYQEESDEQ